MGIEEGRRDGVNFVEFGAETERGGTGLVKTKWNRSPNGIIEDLGKYRGGDEERKK